MTTNKKGRAGRHQATPKTSKYTCNFTSLRNCFKTAVVTLAVWGWFPLCLAEWILNSGGHSDD